MANSDPNLCSKDKDWLGLEEDDGDIRITIKYWTNRGNRKKHTVEYPLAVSNPSIEGGVEGFAAELPDRLFAFEGDRTELLPRFARLLFANLTGGGG